MPRASIEGNHVKIQRIRAFASNEGTKTLDLSCQNHAGFPAGGSRRGSGIEATSGPLTATPAGFGLPQRASD